MSQELGECYLAGVQFRPDAAKVAWRAKPDEEVDFFAEPSNKFDSLAIKVLWKGEHIGYIPAKTDLQFNMHHKHYAGIKLKGTLTEVNPYSKSWRKFKVSVWTVV